MIRETSSDSAGVHLPVDVPPFSLVLETENLASVNPEMLIDSLSSLASQVIPASQAREVILIDSGDTPSDLLNRILADFPWITMLKVESDTDYYTAKMKGFRHTTGDVVVFCDSDCRYEADWLENILKPFADDDAVMVVTGESSVTVTGPYSLCIAMTWYFPPFSMKRKPYPTDGYAANNVAFRRSLLTGHPIPTDIGLYRGNCMLHARQLLKSGHTVWKQPGSRAVHPVLKPSHFLMRFLMAGHHEVVARRKLTETERAGRLATLLTDIINGTVAMGRRFANPVKRLPLLMKHNGVSTILYLPLALPLIVLAAMVMLAGVLITVIMPELSLLGLAKRLEDTEHA